MAYVRARIALLLAGLALGVAACGGDDNGGGGGGGIASAPCPSDAVVIKMVNIKFNPEKATATAGDKICWENEDGVDHDAVADSGASFKSGLFGKGKTFTTTVDKAGTVKYECTIHPGMRGEITVSG
jgi:plastocyanin